MDTYNSNVNDSNDVFNNFKLNEKINVFNCTIIDFNDALNECIRIFNKLNLGKIIYLELENDNKKIKFIIHSDSTVPYHFIIDEYYHVIEARKYSVNGEIIYTKDGKDNKDTTTNNYIIIDSTGHFSEKKNNSIFVDLDENKIYHITYDKDGENYDFYKDLSSNQKERLMQYINDNNLLNVSIDRIVFDASDVIEISIGGKKNVIRNASKEFTNNEMHIFDDIVNIVFNRGNNAFDKIKSFFDMNFKNDKETFTNEIEHDDVKNLINTIDNEIAELEIEKNKIDKEIERNFDEVSNYSIMNKSLEELLSAKKKFINDWDVLLFNTTNELWIMRSATYRVHIASIIDAILLKVEDNISKQQLGLLNSITENKYFGNEDRESVIKIVKQLKELE